MITLIADNKEMPVEWVEFSDGALTCKVDVGVVETKHNLHFNVCPTTPVKQVSEELIAVMAALWEFELILTDIKCVLHLPYLPYGRADRVFEEGNPNMLRWFLNTVDGFLFDEVVLTDVHNPASLTKLQTPYREINQVSCFQYTCKRHNGYVQKWDYVIAPDKGAKDKAKSIADMLGVPIIQASKERDISTGRIIKTELDTTLSVGSRVIICDDILDGGGTFIPLAEELRSQGCTVDLYVTHLIAAKGLDIFKGLFDNIYCYQTVAKYVNKQDVMNFNLGK
ncbi:MAG: hypothetical protein CME43_01880 [Haliea sp.]|uniref:phosphoribosyltransferase family protein n=1 Tax=Haliea sp. TaxID=1932666 RepID=UPI000C37F98D|nr:phosphoribosyltransferase family protein [Haliea sp.]MBM68168.1 hypothetical protein [Haliea sp.]MBM68211.1 hypothetical protein [Haliea sp.]|tara:strand:+ start:666 stop:1508 length:843 start_codon:yes stop_codon:yes gene_type:complete